MKQGDLQPDIPRDEPLARLSLHISAVYSVPYYFRSGAQIQHLLKYIVKEPVFYFFTTVSQYFLKHVCQIV